MLTLSVRAGVLKAALVLGLDALLLACLGFPGVGDDRPVRGAVLASFVFFLCWQLALLVDHRRNGRPFLVVRSHLKKVHLLQFLFQSIVMAYWGFYYRDVYAHLGQLVVQFAFAYLLEMSLAWSLRRAWQLGFSPVPVVMSINLFLWFEHDFFFAQLGVVAAGLFSKTFITWMRDGKRTHIFNPSGLPLAAASLLLLLTDRTELGRGLDFSSSYRLGPNIYEVIFLVGLLVNTQFETVLLTGSAVVTLALVDVVVRASTGLALLPLPFASTVFLGATLLFTDPATTPHSKLGKALAGMLYGVLVSLFIWGLHSVGQPSYYDKVLAVPLVNLAVPGLDRAGRWLREKAVGLGAVYRVLRLHSVQLAAWSAFFVLFMPVIKGAPRPSFPSPTWVRPSSHIEDLMKVRARLCAESPRACRPFGLFAELSYWLYRERRS